MTITSSRFSVPFLRAAATISLLSGIGGMPDRGVLAEDRVDVDPAEDPAEVQRRQQIKQQATHWEQQFAKLLHGDLELLRAVCGDLPREPRRSIAQAGQRAVKDAAFRMAELQMGGRRKRGGRDDGRNAEKSPENPLLILSESLTKSVAEHVGNEQANAYAKQIAWRNERRRTAQIREIVALLDADLVLTAAQREQIERSMQEKWDDSMAIMLQGIHINNGLRMFPGLPAECVSPHLTKAQQQRFVPQPKANNQLRAAWQQQAWMQTVNMLNNTPPAGRDPWWFQ